MQRLSKCFMYNDAWVNFILRTFRLNTPLGGLLHYRFIYGKSEEMGNKKEQLTSKLVEWLKSQGYPLEMTVAAEFQKSGFTVSLSDYYDECDTGESREIDVTALKWSDFERVAVLQVCWRIECKLARDKPWVVFVSGAQPERFLPFNALASSTYKTSLVEAYKDMALRSRLQGLPLIQRYVGHGVTQVFTSGQDIPYKAVMSAAKASLDRINQFKEMEANPTAFQEHHRLLCIAFPVVVIDGKLFECSSDEDGELHVVEVESSALLWKGTGRSYSSTLVQLVTNQALAQFIEQANETTQVLMDVALAYP